jgi:hypothetical protein
MEKSNETPDMRHYNFKMFSETDGDLIQWLDSLERRQRSNVIRQALREYKPDNKEGEKNG